MSEVTAVSRDPALEATVCMGAGGCIAVDKLTYQLRVDRVWKGKVGKTTTLVIIETHGEVLHVGDRRLVFAYSRPPIDIDECAILTAETTDTIAAVTRRLGKPKRR